MTVAGVFGLPHLSEDAVAAFADGVLAASAADRARRHCAECTECAEAVRAQREAALLLRTASNPCAPADLLSRLASVPMSAPLPPPSGGLPTVLGADGRPMFVAHDPRAAGRMNALPQPGPLPGQPDVLPQHPGHRRVLLPIGILASAAAVVAAGAIGSQLTSVPQPAAPQPASVQQLSSDLRPDGQPGPAQSPVRQPPVRHRPARHRPARHRQAGPGHAAGQPALGPAGQHAAADGHPLRRLALACGEALTEGDSERASRERSDEERSERGAEK